MKLANPTHGMRQAWTTRDGGTSLSQITVCAHMTEHSPRTPGKVAREDVCNSCVTAPKVSPTQTPSFMRFQGGAAPLLDPES